MRAILFLPALFLNLLLAAQPALHIDKIKLDKKIDSLFSSYNRKSSPGFAITVLVDGKVISKKSYGMASLEFGIPLTHNTIVGIPYSEGREFISIAAALMEKDNILKLENKVRQYFPKLPAWSEIVTIQDLLNHSSGFCDEWATLVLTQASMSNRLDVSQFLSFLYNQPDPQVEPGKGYMYSNSDFGLLRLILEKASGENLSAYLKRKVFTPLGMSSTQMRNNKEELIPNHALSYYSDDDKKYFVWLRDKTSPGGNYMMLTSAADLEKWAAAHNDANSFISKAVVRLKQFSRPIPAQEGTNYVFGQKVKKIGEHEMIVHQGVSGYSYLARVPDSKLTVICLGNNLRNPFAERINNFVSQLLNVKSPAATAKKVFPSKALPTTNAELQKYAGTYRWLNQLTFQSSLETKKYVIHKIVGDSLFLEFSASEFFPFIKVGDNIFKDPDFPIWSVFSQAHPDSAMEVTVYKQDDNPETWHWKKEMNAKKQYSKEQLQKLTGKYYSKHLDFYWTIVMNEDGNLVVKRPTIADKLLEPFFDNEFKLTIEFREDDESRVWIQFYYNEAGEAIWFDVHNPRLLHHRFDKVKN
ncbi:MAG: beta-lactamase family protein [Cyclobacteriaceae bacterium]|nr:beta-lactamase family protein [Cyclobacteriaceae bacterium]